uniref:DUF1902 domain-containing protein n=1 Tax=Candidatus Kentrum sp. LFY TaxID=2126342 RepID=A0A450WRR8_9GAMM|nr:MAG: protein of unknown function (DUF1902) [Candidatus Kentron sp. LFY]
MNSLAISEHPPKRYTAFDAKRFTSDTREDGFTVRVTRSEGIWIAECDQLGLVTEADNYADLEARTRKIAPELAEMNGLGTSGQSIRLEFQIMEIPDEW